MPSRPSISTPHDRIAPTPSNPVLSYQHSVCPLFVQTLCRHLSAQAALVAHLPEPYLRYASRHIASVPHCPLRGVSAFIYYGCCPCISPSRPLARTEGAIHSHSELAPRQHDATIRHFTISHKSAGATKLSADNNAHGPKHAIVHNERHFILGPVPIRSVHIRHCLREPLQHAASLILLAQHPACRLICYNSRCASPSYSPRCT